MSVDQNLRKAKSAIKKQQYDIAAGHYREILNKFPNNQRALTGLLEIEKQAPTEDVMDSLYSLYKANQFNEVITAAASHYDTHNKSWELNYLFAATKSLLQQWEEAEDYLETAYRYSPTNARILKHYAQTAHYNGKYRKALQLMQKLVAIEPQNLQNLLDLAIKQLSLGERSAAITTLQAAAQIIRDADFTRLDFEEISETELVNNIQKVIEEYEKDRDYQFEQYLQINNFYNKFGDKQRALAILEKAQKLQPENATVYSKIAEHYNSIDDLQQAGTYFEKAIQLGSQDLFTLKTASEFLFDLGEFEKSAQLAARSLNIQPNDLNANSLLISSLTHTCDWSLENQLDKLVDSSSKDQGNSKSSINPFSTLRFTDKADKQLLISKKYYQFNYLDNSREANELTTPVNGKIKVGYYSCDFYDHATMHLIAQLFELHDKQHFEIHIFSYGKQVDDHVSRKLKQNTQHYHDISRMNNVDIAALSDKLGINIAIDLKGYTHNSRFEIFAHRVAPIQISYLGYPGTTGAPFMDYMIADPVTIPSGYDQFYSEKIIYMPNSYQVNDNQRSIADNPTSRAQHNLPEDTFVFCCFNNSYKISPHEFTIWMQLVKQVEGSVLWLYQANEAAEKNLQKEAQKHGVSTDRLIFAPKMPQSEHLERQKHADLFLDTFNVNAHTTASDALWGGLPVITKAGESFAARVAASLLTAIGLPELITHSQEEYAALALHLATHPEELRAIKQKLQQNRHTAPLYDSEGFTRHLERAFEEVINRYNSGAKPENIDVKELIAQ
ncbi:tetratricopeptide repeat protein [Polycladidibacter stylochi]|uniref:tetratricopeptide repeat protein n=1 Tax=Polycladidibacter stylochi TaxID=1807766 RepID=UPI0008345357|nr:tetratricopeptide repeat protein [Pseudovibrio stylochi]